MNGQFQLEAHFGEIFLSMVILFGSHCAVLTHERVWLVSLLPRRHSVLLRFFLSNIFVSRQRLLRYFGANNFFLSCFILKLITEPSFSKYSGCKGIGKRCNSIGFEIKLIWSFFAIIVSRNQVIYDHLSYERNLSNCK